MQYLLKIMYSKIGIDLDKVDRIEKKALKEKLKLTSKYNQNNPYSDSNNTQPNQHHQLSDNVYFNKPLHLEIYDENDPDLNIFPKLPKNYKNRPKVIDKPSMSVNTDMQVNTNISINKGNTVLKVDNVESLKLSTEAVSALNIYIQNY